jgi:hypothetical protein
LVIANAAAALHVGGSALDLHVAHEWPMKASTDGRANQILDDIDPH